MEQMTKEQYVKKLAKEKYELYNIKIPYDKLPWSGQYIDVELADGTVETVDRLAEFAICKTSSFYFIDRYCYTNHPKHGYVPFKLFDFQKKALNDFQDHSKIIFRKCLTEDNYVTTNNGYVSIKNVNIGDKIQTLKNGNIEWTDVEDYWKNKELKEVMSIHLNSGAEIECTLDHKIHTDNRGWVEAQDLTFSDKITSSFGKHDFGNYELEHDEWAALIGYYLARGKARDPRFVNTNRKYIDEALEAGKLFDGISPYIKEIPKEKFHHKQKWHVVYTSRNKGTKNSFNKFKKKYNLDKNSTERHLTSDLMQLNKRQMSIMLNRLYAGNGWYSCVKRNKNTSGKNVHMYEIGLGSPNYKLVKQVQQILHGQYGIYAKIEEQKNAKLQKTRFWKLKIYHKQSILNFINEIGIYDKAEDGDNVKILIEELASGNRNLQSPNMIRKMVNSGIKKETYDITTKNSDFLTSCELIHNCRQMGASVISGAYALWRANFYKKQTIKVISLTKDDAIEFKDKTIDLNYEKMPGFLKTSAKAGRLGRTKFELSNGSIIQVLPKSKNAGRGSTPSLVIIDEAAFNEWMDDIWKAILPALDKGGDIIVISTTNGVGNWYHLTYTRAEEKLNEFHPIFIPWWYYPGRSNPWLDMVLEKINNKEWDENEVDQFIKKMEREQLSYKGDPQHGPWLYSMYINAKSEQEFNQEIMADFLGSGNTVIPFQEINRIEEEWVEEPKWRDILPQDDNNEIIPGLWIWKDRNPESMYMITVDTATGHGKDFSVMEIIDVYNNEQVAEYRWQVPTDEMGRLVKKVASYYNGAYVVIECNHPGPATFNEVYKHKTDPYYNCYIKMKSGQPWGWDTTAKSRVLLIEDFYKNILNQFTRIYSQRLVDEMKVFIWKDEKAQASQNCNDDLIISYSFFCHLVDYAFTSRPVAIHTNKKIVNPNIINALGQDWEEKEDFYKEVYQMTLSDYYWMQGWPIPEDYKKWKQAELEADQKSKQTAQRSRLEDEIMKKELGLEKPPTWIK